MKRTIKKFKALIAAVIAAILVFVLAHPSWLPLSETTRQSLVELEKTHFLIERSGKITAAHLVALLLALCVMWLLYTLIKFILLSIGKKGDRARTVTEMLISTVRYLAVIAAVVWGLSILGVNTTAVLAGIGIIGLIIGFGAQSLIEDILTGAFIIFEGQYHIGDIIVLDDFRGIVRAVGVRTTTIEDTGGNLKVVNNSDIRNFQNRSKKLSLAVCDVDVAYDTDLETAVRVLGEALSVHPLCAGEKPPRVIVTGFAADIHVITYKEIIIENICNIPLKNSFYLIRCIITLSKLQNIGNSSR